MLRKSFFLWILSLFLIPMGFAAAEASSPPVQKLTLNDCLKMGYAYSKDLQVAAKNRKVAEEGVKQAEAALGLTVGYNVSRTQSDSSFNSGSISFDFPAFNYHKLRNALKVAEIQLESARENERRAKLQVAYDIKKAFYTLWLQEQKLAVAKSSYDNLGEHYQIIKKYCEIGKKAGFELLEAEVNWKEQKARVTSAQSNVELAKLDLAILIGIDLNHDFQIIYDASLQQLPEQYQITLQSLLEKAKDQRPDIRQAVLDIQVAELNVAIAKAGNNPALSLSASQNDMDKDLKVMVGVSGKLYDNHLNGSKVKAAEEKLEIARVNESKTMDSMRQSVQKVYQNIQVDLENALAYQANITLHKEHLRLTEVRYNAGMSTIMEVKDRQLDLDQAWNNYYGQVASYLTDLARLDLELGLVDEK